jgi:DNA-binding protein H-NS
MPTSLTNICAFVLCVFLINEEPDSKQTQETVQQLEKVIQEQKSYEQKRRSIIENQSRQRNIEQLLQKYKQTNPQITLPQKN